MSKLIPFIFVIGFCLSSCSCIRSSLNFTQGTEYLYAGNYQEALPYLEKATQLDPSMSRNQNNLALAYDLTGNSNRAWYHSRQAVLCSQDNKPAIITFWRIYTDFVTKRGLDKEDTSFNEILRELGEPDITTILNEETSCQYGICLMVFEKNKLSKCIDMIERRDLLKMR